MRYLEIKEEFGKAMKKIAGCGILVRKERVRDEVIRGLHLWYLDPKIDISLQSFSPLILNRQANKNKNNKDWRLTGYRKLLPFSLPDFGLMMTPSKR